MQEKNFTWSFSSLKLWQQCPAQYAHRYVWKTQKDPRNEEQREEANERGERVHQNAESYITTANAFDLALPSELGKMEAEYKALRKLHEQMQLTDGTFEVEREWAYDRNWKPTDWKADDRVVRAKLDVCVTPRPTFCLIIDHKTGKYFGNEHKHGEQGEFYAVCALMRKPDLRIVKTEFWYVDHGKILQNIYNREQIMGFRAKFEAEAALVKRQRGYTPSPSRLCNWCDWRKQCPKSAATN